MSPPIKNEILDWKPLTMDRDMSAESKALIGKLSNLKIDRLTRIDHFDTWLIAITRALRSAGLEDYLNIAGRASKSRYTGGTQWIAVSKQIASWMKHHVDGTLFKVLRARGEALIFADTFIDKAKKAFETGHLADELRLEKFLAYEEGFILMRSHGIKMGAYPALLTILSHIKQSHKQVHDKTHHMLEIEVDFAKSRIAEERDVDASTIQTAEVVTSNVFLDFASRTATLLDDVDI
ncbi:Shikimate kinase [Penicillium longicatenatum]|nr:Shikimate kinase [Penicillium longicatenatum]